MQNLRRIGLLWLIWVVAVEALPAQSLATNISSKIVIVESGWYEYSPEPDYFRRFPSNDYFTRPNSYNSLDETFDCYSLGLSSPCAALREREKQFAYQVRIRNAGEEQIVALGWEYIFIDPETKKVIKRHSFHTRTRIQPHKFKTLSEISASPPTSVIDVRMLNKDSASQFTERILVNSVVFRDGQSRQIITREIK